MSTHGDMKKDHHDLKKILTVCANKAISKFVSKWKTAWIRSSLVQSNIRNCVKPNPSCKALSLPNEMLNHVILAFTSKSPRSKGARFQTILSGIILLFCSLPTKRSLFWSDECAYGEWEKIPKSCSYFRLVGPFGTHYDASTFFAVKTPVKKPQRNNTTMERTDPLSLRCERSCESLLAIILG